MAEEGTFQVVFDYIPAIILQIPGIFGLICLESAIEMSHAYTDAAPRLTGDMANSVYVKTHNFSTYDNKGIDAPLLPEIDAPESKTEADCAVAAEYAAYVEYGTRYMAAQPTFAPSFDLAQALFVEKLANAESRFKVK